MLEIQKPKNTLLFFEDRNETMIERIIERHKENSIINLIDLEKREDFEDTKNLKNFNLFDGVIDTVAELERRQESIETNGTFKNLFLVIRGYEKIKENNDLDLFYMLEQIDKIAKKGNKLNIFLIISTAEIDTKILKFELIEKMEILLINSMNKYQKLILRIEEKFLNIKIDFNEMLVKSSGNYLFTKYF